MTAVAPLLPLLLALIAAPASMLAGTLRRSLDECCVVGRYRFVFKREPGSHGLWPYDPRPLAGSAARGSFTP